MNAEPDIHPLQMFLQYARIVTARKGLLLTVLAAAILAGLGITHSMPKTYRATCLIQVQPDDSSGEPFSPSSDRQNRFDRNFLQTQFELIQSDQVVEEVVRVLGLAEVLFPEARDAQGAAAMEAFERAVRLVSGKIRVQQKKDTDLIEIFVDFDQPRSPPGQAALWAARIANTVGKVFQDQTQRRRRETVEQALRELRSEIETLDERIAKTERRLDEVRDRYNIVESDPPGAANFNAQVLVQAETARAKAEIELRQKKVLLDQVLSLKDAEAATALPLLVQSKALANLLAERRNAEVLLNGQLQSLGEKHRSVERTRALIDELTNKINEEVRGIRAGLQADYEAARVAYEHIRQYAEELRQREQRQAASGYREFRNINSELLSLRQRRKTWEESYLRQRLQLRLPHTAVTIVQRAKMNLAAAPVSPRLFRNLAISVFFGLFAGVSLSLLLEVLNTSVKTVEDVKRHLRAPVLAVIPRRVHYLHSPRVPPIHFEAYRALRTNLKLFRPADEGQGCLLCITSAAQGEGKTQTLFNLAYVCAQFGDRVLIVDANLHRPEQHRILNVSNRLGLYNLLTGETTLAEAVQTTSLRNLHLLAGGTLRNAPVPGLFEGNILKEAIRELKRKYHWILFDAPCLIGTCDAVELVRHADGVLLVVQHRRYPRPLLQRARESIDALGGKLTGVVLNNMNLSRDDALYKYRPPHAQEEEKPAWAGIRLWRESEARRDVGT